MKKPLGLFILIFCLFCAPVAPYAHLDSVTEAGPNQIQKAAILYLNVLRLVDTRFFRDLTDSENEIVTESTKLAIEDILAADKYADLVSIKDYEKMLERGFSGIGIYFNVPEQQVRAEDFRTLFKKYFPLAAPDIFADPFVNSRLIPWLVKRDPVFGKLYGDLKDFVCGPNGVEIREVIKGGPADRAGLGVGWRIIAIDGQPACGLPLRRLIDLLKGSEGTEVELVVTPPGNRTSVNVVTLTRKEIKKSSYLLNGRVLKDGIGYINLKEFYDKSEVDFADLYSDLKKQGAKSYVIDLQGNPGGLLSAALIIAGKFLRYDDSIISVETQKGGVNPKFREEVTNYWSDPTTSEDKLVILMDGDSASASEVVATALKDYKRAVVIGTRSYGKGCVQTLMGLDEDYFLKLTTNLYFSPVNHNKIDNVGIIPDIEITDDPETPEDEILQKAIEILSK